MTNRTALSPKACTAIAAVLAAVSTPAFAQDTAVPDPAPAPVAEAPAAAAPAPVVVPVVTPEPVVQPVAEASVATPDPVAAAPVAATTTARATPRSAVRAAAPVAAAPVAAQASAPVAASAPIADAAPTTPLASPAPIASAQPVATPVAAPTNDNTAELGLGLLGLAAFGGLGAYAASRRRRRVVSDERIDAPVTRVATVEPVAEPVQAAWAPTATTATAVPAPFMFERKPAASPATSTSRVRSTDMIPAGPLPTGEAMRELFERMVAASPDKDNPFKSEKRRRARVRWLMKQHEYRLADPEGMTEADRYAAKQDGFDFRTYKPSIKRPADEVAAKEVVPA